MKINQSRTSTVFLILGMAFLAIGIATDNTDFTWVAIGLVLASLLIGGRWRRMFKPGRK